MNKKKKKKLPYCYNKIFPLLLFIATLFMGIGYAVINSISLEVSGTVMAQEPDNLFISEIEFNESKNEDLEKLDTISTFQTTLNSKVTLSKDDADSYVSYIVTIYNNTSDTYYYKGTTFDENFYDNLNIVYTVKNLNNDNILKSNNVAVFEITFQYKDSTTSDNNILNSYIKFCFSKAHLITYKNLAGDNLPKYAIDSEDLSITFTNNIPADVQIYRDDILVTDYTYSNNILIIPNVIGEIKIVGYVPSPNLSDDLIPVVYDGNDWIAVDENEEWYDYGKQQWANAVIPKSSVSIATGDIVDLENDIKGIFVWIPRYEYRISTDGSNEIYINFISTEKTTASSDYILPDAFTFGTSNVDGVWLGKFETSMDSSTQELYVIPNKVAVTSQTMSTQYSLGLAFNDDLISTNIDTHMAKNSEWGVTAYLSQSLYGKFGNSDYTGDNKEIYVNNSLGLYTGRSGGNTSPEGSTYGTYNYDDGFVNGTEESGIGASTTGNIYGIYDMSGGAYEYVMGYLTTASSTFGSTNTGYNAAGFSSTPNSKYYDGYTSSVSSSSPYNSHALGETTGWYGDGSVTISGDTPWYMRGGVVDGGTEAGIFAYGTTSGYMGSYASFRMALIITN